MTDARTASKELQEQILDTIHKSQEAVTDAIRTCAETVQSITPSLPTPQLPFADKLPKPGEVVANAYDFAEQLSLSNPNLSQVERGMHQPSVRVLKLIAEALNISAETLLVQAGLLDAEDPDAVGPTAEQVTAAIRADHRLTSEQKAALIAVYDSMLGTDRSRDL